MRNFFSLQVSIQFGPLARVGVKFEKATAGFRYGINNFMGNARFVAPKLTGLIPFAILLNHGVVSGVAGMIFGNPALGANDILGSQGHAFGFGRIFSSGLLWLGVGVISYTHHWSDRSLAERNHSAAIEKI